MRAIARVMLVAMLACASATAQGPTRPRRVQGPQIEYGSPLELRGVHKVFVDTGTDLESRQEIIHAIHSSIPDIVFVDSANDAEAFVVYRVDVQTYVDVVQTATTTTDAYGTTQTQSAAVPQYHSVAVLQAYVATQPAPDRLRLLLSYDDGPTARDAAAAIAPTAVSPVTGHVGYASLRAASPLFARRPSSRFGDQFVKAWKEANPGYKKGASQHP